MAQGQSTSSKTLQLQLDIAKRKAEQFVFHNISPSKVPLPSWWQEKLESCDPNRCTPNAITPDGKFRAEPRLSPESAIEYMTISQNYQQALLNLRVTQDFGSEKDRASASTQLIKVKIYKEKLIEQYENYLKKKQINQPLEVLIW